MLNINDKNAIVEFLEKTEYRKKDDFLSTTEYRESYNADKLYSFKYLYILFLYNRTESYVSTRANSESEFWKGSKNAYEDKMLKDSVLFKSTNRLEFKSNEVPENFKSKDHSRKVTRISEYSNALYNNNVFKNPSFLSC